MPVPFHIFRLILSFIYTNEVFVGIDYISHVASAAELFELDRLVTLCNIFPLGKANIFSLPSLLFSSLWFLLQAFLQSCYPTGGWLIDESSLVFSCALESSLNDPTFSDFELHCQGHIFPVHKVLLASGNELFYTLLTTKTFIETATDRLELNHIKPQAFCILLHSIYTKNIFIDCCAVVHEKMDVCMLVDTFIAANYFLHKQLQQRVENIIVTKAQQGCGCAIKFVCEMSHISETFHRFQEARIFLRQWIFL